MFNTINNYLRLFVIIGGLIGLAACGSSKDEVTDTSPKGSAPEKPKVEAKPSLENCQTLERKDFKPFIAQSLTEQEKSDLIRICENMDEKCFTEVASHLKNRGLVLRATEIFNFLETLD